MAPARTSRAGGAQAMDKQKRSAGGRFALLITLIATCVAPASAGFFNRILSYFGGAAPTPGPQPTAAAQFSPTPSLHTPPSLTPSIVSTPSASVSLSPPATGTGARVVPQADVEYMISSIKRHVAGQDLDVIFDSLRAWDRLGRDRPATLLFAGSTNVGKSWTAEIIYRAWVMNYQRRDEALAKCVVHFRFKAQHKDLDKLRNDIAAALAPAPCDSQAVIVFDEVQDMSPQLRQSALSFLPDMIDPARQQFVHGGKTYKTSKSIIIIAGHLDNDDVLRTLVGMSNATFAFTGTADDSALARDELRRARQLHDELQKRVVDKFDADWAPVAHTSITKLAHSRSVGGVVAFMPFTHNRAERLADLRFAHELGLPATCNWRNQPECVSADVAALMGFVWPELERFSFHIDGNIGTFIVSPQHAFYYKKAPCHALQTDTCTPARVQPTMCDMTTGWSIQLSAKETVRRLGLIAATGSTGTNPYEDLRSFLQDAAVEQQSEYDREKNVALARSVRKIDVAIHVEVICDISNWRELCNAEPKREFCKCTANSLTFLDDAMARGDAMTAFTWVTATVNEWLIDGQPQRGLLQVQPFVWRVAAWNNPLATIEDAGPATAQATVDAATGTQSIRKL